MQSGSKMWLDLDVCYLTYESAQQGECHPHLCMHGVFILVCIHISTKVMCPISVTIHLLWLLLCRTLEIKVDPQVCTNSSSPTIAILGVFEYPCSHRRPRAILHPWLHVKYPMRETILHVKVPCPEKWICKNANVAGRGSGHE